MIIERILRIFVIFDGCDCLKFLISPRTPRINPARGTPIPSINAATNGLNNLRMSIEKGINNARTKAIMLKIYALTLRKSW